MNEEPTIDKSEALRGAFVSGFKPGTYEHYALQSINALRHVEDRQQARLNRRLRIFNSGKRLSRAGKSTLMKRRAKV